jgi:hypothetical protein
MFDLIDPLHLTTKVYNKFLSRHLLFLRDVPGDHGTNHWDRTGMQDFSPGFPPISKEKPQSRTAGG